jgi:V8-like Glu-specific endopeptidase
MFKEQFKVSFVIIAAIFSIHSYAARQKSICGAEDNRVPSTFPKIGRLLGTINSAAGCTVTMIGKTCALSAGHCTSTFGIAEFNTPPSVNGRIQHPSDEDIYRIDRAKTESVDGGVGNDWAVLRVLPNEITGKYAGDVQGYYDVSFQKPANGDIIRITGYGLDQSEPDRNFAQQTHTGEISSIRGSSMYHVADTMGGNSGSTIIRESDERIVGIHTHGGCTTRSGSSNGSTAVAEKPALIKAIEKCLMEEADL